jgi:protein-disulfide isomerase
VAEVVDRRRAGGEEVKRLASIVTIAVGLAALAGACKKGATPAAEAAKSADPPAAAPAVPSTATPPAPAVKAPAGPEPKLPPMVLDGIDLEADARARFFALYDKLPSPCGKPQNLHAAVDTDPTCKRAPFAARWVAHMLTLANVEDEQMVELFGQRYKRQEPFAFDLAGVSHVGGDPKTAKITMVEFFDYGCPHCKAHVPVMDKLLEKFGKNLVLYYMNFPIGGWKTSEPAAQAALAADRQGKFDAFHHALFDAQGHQEADDVRAVAKKVGLDMTRFEADWKDPKIAAMVKAQREQGVKANLQSTPMIWVNGREYLGVPEPSWLSDAIAEELAAQAK